MAPTQWQPNRLTSARPESGEAVKPTMATAIRRGLLGRCPSCGKSHLFNGYLRVVTNCAHCDAPLGLARADDAPPYMTIFVVGHIIGAGMLWVEHQNDALPIWIHATIWPILTVVLSFYFLPRIKGGLIGLQWALRMHGFGAQASSADPALPAAFSSAQKRPNSSLAGW
jgi:uncharacterized protein (DUF983 family)